MRFLQLLSAHSFSFLGGIGAFTIISWALDKMKQKVVLKVSMRCQKCRTEALKVAAKQEGVSFVGLEGEQRDKVAVIGDGVDVVKLTTNLRKKVGDAQIISLAEQK